MINLLDNKMRISSTEFQQNVGKYLRLVEKGEVLKVVRNKPVKRVFEIRVSEDQLDSGEKGILEILAEIRKEYPLDPNGRLANTDPLEYQRQVRS